MNEKIKKIYEVIEKIIIVLFIICQIPVFFKIMKSDNYYSNLSFELLLYTLGIRMSMVGILISGKKRMRLKAFLFLELKAFVFLMCELLSGIFIINYLFKPNGRFVKTSEYLGMGAYKATFSKESLYIWIGYSLIHLILNIIYYLKKKKNDFILQSCYLFVIRMFFICILMTEWKFA